ncbi:NAD(P)-binding protein [Penicillium cinerascens]|uniref:NAD(P)-binding protein n=1 Tax=Penicillium cinerascens TaxID=70096 RepID=A0A9W9NGE9_9EURO|nr:NAD(P)-binding protein [Penicillium cinerascens]KAJ5219494.1 NAD(P)-binding protein [Penicillium cinerascens]
MHILSEPDVSRIFRSLTQKQCHAFIGVLGSALVGYSAESKPTVPESEKLIHQPLRTVFTTKANNSCIFMPVSDTTTSAVKVVTVGNSGIQGTINIFSPEGRLQGLLAAAEVTAFRTALASMSTLREMYGMPDLHYCFTRTLIRRVTFINRGRQRLDEMERDVLGELRKRYPNVSIGTFAKEGAADYDGRLLSELQAADAIFSCTPSSEPNFKFEALQSAPKQRFISLIGSYKPHMHEIDTETLLSGGARSTLIPNQLV